MAQAPAAVRARALELLRDGLSVRGVEDRLRMEGMRFGKSSIAELAKAAAKAPPKAAAVEPSAVPSETPAASSAAAVEPSAAPPAFDPGMRDVAQLEATAELFSARIQRAIKEADLRVLAGLVPLRLQISQTLARVRPPPKLDPEADPSNLAAREELLARVERLAAEAEATEATRAAIRAHLAALEAAGASGERAS